MKHLLNGVAIVVALAFAAPAWAQGGGNPIGTPGPNPGGPGLTPYSTGAPAPEAHPPRHRHAHAHHAAHGRMAARPLTGSSADQLNQQELARLQSGGTSMPPPGPGMPPPSSGPRPRGTVQ
jgi:hypothetical protein